MRPEKPIAYQTTDGDWLCPTCWYDAATVSATPYYREQFADPVRTVCRDCEEPLVVPKTSKAESCVFCDIVAGREPAQWVLQPDTWPDAVAFMPLNPVVEGHTLIVPKVHVRDFAEDPDVFAATARRAAELMRFTPRAMDVLTTRGEEAGQEIMHLHLHLIPREEGDGIRLLTRKKGGKFHG